MLSWRGAADGRAGVGRLLILLLLDDGRIVQRASSETALDQQVMQLIQCRYRHARRAERHSGAGGGIQDPGRGHDDHAGCRLEENNGSGSALLATLAPDAATIEGVPAIMDLDRLPDMGRMTGQLPSGERHGSSAAPIAAGGAAVLYTLIGTAKLNRIDPQAWLADSLDRIASLPAGALDAGATVLAYKSLAGVERAFRSLKTVDLEVRPVHHRLAGRVRAHVFLCMLAYHVTWHMRQALAPLLFEDHDRAAAAMARPSPVAAARVSPAAAAKAAKRRTAEGQPVHSWRSVLQDLATLTRNTVRLGDAPPLTLLTRPTPLHQDAFHKLGLAL